MASSNRPSKDKRQRQNRQRRQARAARSAHAGEATAITRGDDDGSSKASPTTSARTAGAKKKGTPRPKRESPFKIPGQRAVVMAFLFSLVSAGTLLLAPIQVERDVAPDDPRVELDDGEEPDLNDDGTVTIIEDAKLIDEEGAGIAAGVILTPILITGAAAWFAKRPQRSNAWTMAMVALSAYIFLFAGPYGVIALPSLIALAVGGFQSRRAENRERLAQIKADRAARADAGDGDVIDVESEEVSDGDLTDEDEAADDDGEPAAQVDADDHDDDAERSG